MLNQAPWNIKGHLLFLKPWSLGATLHEISLNHAAFNVQIHGLPLDHITLDNAIEVGKALGNLIKVEEDPLYGLAFRKFIRLKVELDVTKPLQQGFKMPRLGNHEIWIAIKYEKLADFCYACGRLGHSQIFCGYLSSTPTRLSYGPWIRAEFQSSFETNQTFHQTSGGQYDETDPYDNFSPSVSTKGHYNKGKQNLNVASSKKVHYKVKIVLPRIVSKKFQLVIRNGYT